MLVKVAALPVGDGVEPKVENLRRPLVALLLSPNPKMWQAAERGEKLISIREGYRDYRVDETLMICCHIRDCAFMATVTGVNHCTLGQVTEEEWVADGFTSQADLLAGLREFYPNMTLDSGVTVLRWSNLRGSSVDLYKR